MEPWKIKQNKEDETIKKWTVLTDKDHEPNKWEMTILSHPNAFRFYPFKNLVGKFQMPAVHDGIRITKNGEGEEVEEQVEVIE